MSSPACHQITLAKNGIAHVQRCTQCECISLHIGATTLRVDPQALEALWGVLGDAAGALHAQKSASRTIRGVA